MRFVLAATVLVESLATVNSSATEQAELKALGSSSHVEGAKRRRRHHRRIRQLNQKDEEAGSSFFPIMTAAPFGSRLDRPFRLQNDKSNTNKRDVECDPYLSEEHADVGILSCGAGKYCMESTDSSMGGLCVDNVATDRTLQVVGNKTVFELAYDLCYTTKLSHYSCECNMDLDAKSGMLSCVGSERCAELYSGCYSAEKFQYCLTGTVEAVINGPSTYSYSTCYTQRMPATNYEFSYCTHFDFDVINGPTCEMEVDGVTCDSCSINIGGGNTYGENCEVFDCRNTALRFAGDRCGLFANPTLLVEAELNYLYQTFWPCPGGCNLCGENGYMTNGRANFTYTSPLLATESLFQCYDIMYGAMVGSLTETSYCDTLPPLAQEPCGCVTGGSGEAIPAGATPIAPTMSPQQAGVPGFFTATPVDESSPSDTPLGGLVVPPSQTPSNNQPSAAASMFVPLLPLISAVATFAGTLFW